MIKTFCDVCGEEITEKNKVAKERMKAEVEGQRGKTLFVEIVTNCYADKNRIEGGQAGDFCKYCILDALYKFDDRLKYKIFGAGDPKKKG